MDKCRQGAETTPNNDLLEQLDRHLASPNLAWLLGAGISVDAGIPLMYPLTERVMKLLADSVHKTDCLEQWRKRAWGARVHVATQKGLFVGEEGPNNELSSGGSRDWWRFSGLTKLLRDGAGSAT